MSTDVAVVILTFNEERNLPHALSSVCGWAHQVFVVDSFSSDRTVEIAKAAGAAVVQNRFVDYGSQRNFALTELPITTEWIFFLDADEMIPEALKNEIDATVGAKPRESGFFVRFRLIWMGKWVRRGYYGAWLLRLFRRGRAHCETRAVNEHVIVDGEVGYLQSDIVHEDRKALTDWIEKHNRYATKEAEALLRPPDAKEIEPRLWGSQTERKRWIRRHVWNRMPPLARPFAYFGYRCFLRGGILDGPEALAYHFLQGLWFQLLVDMKYLEMRRTEARGE